MSAADGLAAALTTNRSFQFSSVSERIGLSSRSLHTLVGEDEVLPGLRLVAVEAGREIGIRIGSLVGAEGLILPLAIALRLGIFGAPARAPFHHGVAHAVAWLDGNNAWGLPRI